MEVSGALVGWSHHDNDERILLRLESMQGSTLAANEPDLLRLLMTKQQALVLGHYLMMASGESVPASRTSWFRRAGRQKRNR